MSNKEVIYKPYIKDGIEISGLERKNKVQKLMASMMINYLNNNKK